MKKHVIAAILASLLLVGCSNEYSSGDRYGKIIKLSKKGFLCKSWEGELMLGSIGSNIFNFSVTDERVVELLQNSMNRGADVKLTYSQKFIVLPCTIKTDYVVTRVQ